MDSPDLSVMRPRKFIDKLGLQFPAMYFSGEVYRQFAKGDVTIVRWGDWAQVLIHQEAIVPFKTLADSIVFSLARLASSGVFLPPLGYYTYLLFDEIISGKLPPSFALAQLLHFFHFNEMEVTMDFPNIEYLATISEDFRRVFNTTYYSNDGTKIRRGEDSQRAHEYKGKQKSFIKTYRKDLQAGLAYPLYRLEFVFSGKYSKYLDPMVLNFSQEDAFEGMIPAIKKLCHSITSPDHLVFNPALLLHAGSILGDFLEKIDWLPPVPEEIGGAY